MPLEYDRSFAPFVIPAGVPESLDMVPGIDWFARMLDGQVRVAAGKLLYAARERLPTRVRLGPLGQAIDRARAIAVPPATGAIPEGGDAGFAWRRLAGMNPVLIRRVRAVDELTPRLRLDDATTGRVLGRPQRLLDRLAAGDLYLLDLRLLADAGPVEPQPGRFVAPAVALFCHAPELDTFCPLVPLAIECPVGAAHGETGVFTPLDGDRWKAAKHIVNVADVQYAELCLHLARCHFTVASFTMALHRVVPRGHALYAFLLPHMRFEWFVSKMAWLQGLRTDDGILIRSLAGTARWSQSLARTHWERHTFRDLHLERDLAARGMDDAPVAYPYRDDGRLLWAAIERLVRAFVARAWPDEASLAADAAVHAFLAEAGAPEGGNVRGLLAGERLASREEWVEVLTTLLFVSGPVHALAHYGCGAELQDMDRNPSYLTANPIAEGLRALPGKGAIHQFTRVMSAVQRHDRMGDFSAYPGLQGDEFAEYREALARAEETIAARNATRYAPFVHFLPSRVTNGITV